MIELSLPVPPSVNALFFNRKGGRGRGRIRSKAYRAWIVQADQHFLLQKRGLGRLPIMGPLRLVIAIPFKVRGDVTNRIKAAEDYLVSREITTDDKNNWEVLVKKDRTVECCVITISPILGLT